MKKFLFLLIAIAFLTAACGSDQTEDKPTTDTATTPTESSSEENAAISLISPQDGALPMGDAEIVVEAIDPESKQPIPLEDLQVNLSMAMDEMEPMTTMTKIEPGAQPGHYKIMTNLGMAGMWTMEVESGDRAEKATFNLDVK